jgi:molybdopterin-synthase adenylyltransferase
MKVSGHDVDFNGGRYSRHKLLDWFDQHQIASTRVLVVGAGAIGNEVLKNLALLGVRFVDICDMDLIEVHNLTRSVLFRESDVGQPKAEVAARAVREILPEVIVNVFVGDLVKIFTPSALRAYNIVFSCLDNFEARLQLDEICLLASVDLVSGAIDARFASIEIFPYGSSQASSCYSCNLPPGAYLRIAERYSCGWLRRVGLVERKVPTTTITSSVAGAMMVSWGLRLGTGASEMIARRLLQDTFTGIATQSVLEKNCGCPSCSAVRGNVHLLQWNEALSFSAEDACGSLQARSPTEIVFSAVCEACGNDASASVTPGSRVRDYETSARVCEVCKAEAVVIEAKDTATLRDFAALKSGIPPDVPYLLVDIGDNTICLEVQNERRNFSDHSHGGSDQKSTSGR